jgi:hypothetical protein
MFDNDELSILKLFYKGMSSEELQLRHERDPMLVVNRHKAMPKAEHDVVLQEIATMKMTIMGLALPDDPIFSEGVSMFSVRRS